MYQYETSPKKLIEYDVPKKKAKKPKNESKKQKEKMIEKERKMGRFNFTVILIITLGCLLLIVFRNVKINESFSKIQSLQKEIAALEKENSQISVNIQNSLNLSNIEKTAETTLGMQKLTNKQTVYVSLDTKDYVEVNQSSNTEEKENFFSKIWNSFLDLF